MARPLWIASLVPLASSLLVAAPWASSGSAWSPSAARPSAGSQETERVRLSGDLHPGGARSLAEELGELGFDVLPPDAASDTVEIVVAPGELTDLESSYGPVDVLEVGRPLDALAAADGALADYPDGDEVLAQLEAIAASYPTLARVVDLGAMLGTGTTFEGRSIHAIVISDHVELLEDEPALLVTGALHSRELVTPVIALEAATRLTASYGDDPEVTEVVDGNEIWIVPVCNPDGYAAVFELDNLWRKNRRVFPGGIGVDLNRNYDFGWDSGCSGSSSVGSATYKGPAAASEVETQTLVALAAARPFAKVVDLHSSGREVLWGYNCHTHPLEDFLRSEAVALSTAAGYGGDERPPSADGELYHWHLARYGSHAFLIETHSTFQPSHASAVLEAEQVFGGLLWLLQRPVPLTGHVNDACTDAPLEASLRFPGLDYGNGESLASGGAFGRFDAFLPAGSGLLQIVRPGFEPFATPVVFSPAGTVQVEADLAAQALLTAVGTAQPGTQLAIEIAFPADAGASYAGGMTLSGTTPGVPLNACSLPANVDSIFVSSLLGSGPFAGFAGQLDPSGAGAASVDLPPNPALAGLQVHFAFLTFLPSGAPAHVSPALPVTLQP